MSKHAFLIFAIKDKQIVAGCLSSFAKSVKHCQVSVSWNYFPIGLKNGDTGNLFQSNSINNFIN